MRLASVDQDFRSHKTSKMRNRDRSNYTAASASALAAIAVASTAVVFTFQNSELLEISHSNKFLDWIEVNGIYESNQF
ncbi:hypothetical protein B5S28_g2151 [[Candida] boidinii]|nr:hypothetical protein B5S28_g2151 [[Candida] boidinii]OWB78438.1 hypothetical protein B5S32_g2632 [[Candida] boidinii]